MQRYNVTLRFNAEITLPVDAASEKDAEAAARRVLARRFSEGGIVGRGNNAYMNLGPYHHRLTLFPEFAADAEVIDVEKRD